MQLDLHRDMALVKVRLETRVAIEEATTPASRARAESMPNDVDYNLVLDLQRRRQELLRRRVSGDNFLNTATGEVVYVEEGDDDLGDLEMFDDYDYWARWRADLERSYGRV